MWRTQWAVACEYVDTALSAAIHYGFLQDIGDDERHKAVRKIYSTGSASVIAVGSAIGHLDG